jgi:hypothetical protein
MKEGLKERRIENKLRDITIELGRIKKGKRERDGGRRRE